jgi:hypothetical protein|tara:strand:- start:16880 stop:17206 length:327 start_codon:yes stop_codon:yes gene_type:complete
MCKFISRPLRKIERASNKLIGKPLGINTNIFGGGLNKGGAPMVDESAEDLQALSDQANEELAEEKQKATEDTIQQTTAKRFRSGSRGRRSLLRSKSGGGAGFYNRFQL